MSAYIHHAAYFISELDWYIHFFYQTFGMTIERTRPKADGLREIWLTGGLQLIEIPPKTPANGKAAHLCLLVEDLESCRDKALSLGCAPMEQHHWVQLPDGFTLELFEAAEGAIQALDALPKRK